MLQEHFLPSKLCICDQKNPAPPKIKKAPTWIFLGGALAPRRSKKCVEAWWPQVKIKFNKLISRIVVNNIHLLYTL